MTKINKIPQAVIQFMSIFAAYFVVRLFVFSSVIGSHTACFSASNIVMPVVSTGIDGFIGLLITLVLHSIYFVTTQHVASSLLLICHIPQLFASGMMLVHNSVAKAFFFLCAIFLFIVHPVGSVAWIYPCLWLIPMVSLLWAGTKIERALTATFAAHVVGSLIYLYAIPMTAAQWVGLVPVVLVERGVFALGIVGLLYAQEVVTHVYKSRMVAR